MSVRLIKKRVKTDDVRSADGAFAALAAHLHLERAASRVNFVPVRLQWRVRLLYALITPM